jgi:hypothetical protein
MKQAFVKIVSKKFIMVAVISTLTFTAINQAKAGSTINQTDSSQSTVQYVGTTEKGILFNVKFNNESGAKFNLIIKDENGDFLFNQQYNDKNFNKNIVLVKDADDAKLTFFIEGREMNLKESFTITTSARVIEDVTVTKAK